MSAPALITGPLGAKVELAERGGLGHGGGVEEPGQELVPGIHRPCFPRRGRGPSACEISDVIALLLLLLAAAPPEPARAVQGFFAAVAEADYATAWGLLTEHSRDGLVARVAKDSGKPAEEVAELFQRDDPWVRRAFWDTFRVSSKADRVCRSRFTTAQVLGGQARVEAVDAERRTSTFLAYRTAEGWRFGLIEGMPPGNPFQSAGTRTSTTAGTARQRAPHDGTRNAASAAPTAYAAHTPR